MKSFFIFIIAISIYSNIDAQNITINNDLNKFVGTWRWTSGSDTVEIVLQKQVYQNSYEKLVGWHKFVKNGQIIETSMQYVGRDVNIDFNSNALDFKTTLGGFTRPSQPNNVYFTLFWDLTLHKWFELRFNLLPNSTTQASWKLKYVGYRRISNTSQPPELPGCTLPRDLILTKL